ncbi:MAG: SdpI family protein [Actinomycetota bacterium]
MNSPIKPTFKSEAISLAVIIASVITSFTTYNSLPTRVITHWNFYGQADGWSSRGFHALLFPGLIIAMYVLFLILPNLDPKKERYQDFIKPYNIFRTTLLVVFYIIFLLSTLVNLGYNINIGKAVPFIIGLLMIFIGNYMGKIKKNWFVGIRTPWTLSSENVWNKTHRFAGIMFVLFGLLLIISPYLEKTLGITVFVIGILLVSLVPMAYSYILYRKEKK